MNELAPSMADSETTAHAARIEHQNDVPVLVLTSDADYESLRDELELKFNEDEAWKSLQGQTVRLDLGERDIILLDLRRLQTWLRESADVHIGGLSCRPQALHNYAEKQLKMKIHVDAESASMSVDSSSDDVDSSSDDVDDDKDTATEDPTVVVSPVALVEASTPSGEDVDASASVTPTDTAEEAERDAMSLADAASPALVDPPTETTRDPVAVIPDGGRRTISVHRSLRSGSVVRFPGDVVIFGDVNPGAEIIADGSVVVLGALRGMAHAGAGGDEDASVLAFTLRPTNLRIAQRQATDLPTPEEPNAGILELLRPSGLSDRMNARGAAARVARVLDGQVSIEDYSARDLR